MTTNIIAALRDDFENNVIDPSWGLSAVTGSATKAEVSGQAVLTLPSSAGAGPHSAYYLSSGQYDITGDGAYIQIGTMVATGVAATAYFILLLDSANYYQWIQTSGTVKAQKIVAGVATDLYSASWSSSTHKYLRIRESAGTVYFDSSTNGTSWTARGNTTIAAAFAVTALYVQFGASCGNVASPGAFKLDAFNVILPALATTWRHTTASRALRNRIRTLTLAATSGQGCVATADDVDSSGNLVSPRYFAGPVGSSSGGYNQLVEYSTLAAAQAMAVNLPADDRWDLPAQVECRVIRLYHRSTSGSSYTLREYYPRRLVQADDIEAEQITALHIAAGTITADKITAAFTITGKEIRTNDSGARAVMSGWDYGGFIGYGAADTYNPVDGTGTYQVLWKKSDGKLYAGGGNTILDANGLTVISPDTNAYSDIRALRFSDGANIYGRLQGRWWSSSALNELRLAVTNAGGRGANAVIDVDSTAAQVQGNIYLNSRIDGTLKAQIIVQANNVANASHIELNYGYVTIPDGGLNVGTATGAGTGEIRTSGAIYPPRSSGSALFALDATSQGAALTIANNSTAQPFGAAANFSGLLIISDTNVSGSCGVFVVGGGGGLVKIAESLANFSAVAGTASKINVYLSSSIVTIENKLGSSVTLNVMALRTRSTL